MYLDRYPVGADIRDLIAVEFGGGRAPAIAEIAQPLLAEFNRYGLFPVNFEKKQTSQGCVSIGLQIYVDIF